MAALRALMLRIHEAAAPFMRHADERVEATANQLPAAVRISGRPPGSRRRYRPSGKPSWQQPSPALPGGHAYAAERAADRSGVGLPRPDAEKVIHEHANTWPGEDLRVGRSGNLTIERVLHARFGNRRRRQTPR
ncbi:hypothetical protein GCM10010266_57430 [Streptomyces griseomycini]|nr:hypothetical protein GCM10010266_57430 [Streptomyces griseomycini]GGR58963.1 hypothetical protein GCM10015536_74350 [Streptomyces griseomycini]